MGKTFFHPSLGPLNGVEEQAIIQYRNLPFAKFNGRWKDADLHPGPLAASSETYDAAKFGPLCPQVQNGISLDFVLVGKDLPHEEFYEQSEEHGLNAVVTVPRGQRASEKLPVLVW